MTTFVLATHNEGKKRELLAILGPVLGADTVVLTAAEAGLRDVAETGVTFAENALIKARAAAAATGHQRRRPRRGTGHLLRPLGGTARR